MTVTKVEFFSDDKSTLSISGRNSSENRYLSLG
jgi:hypothetical protein